MANTPLGIIVTQTGADQVKAELLSVGDAGDTAAAKVAASFQATAQSATQSAQQMTASQVALAQAGVTLEQVMAAVNGQSVAAVSANGQNEASIRKLIVAEQAAFAEEERRQAAVRALAAAEAAAYAQEEARVAQLRRMTLLQAEAIAMDKARTAALEQGSAAQGVHGLQLGRVNNELGTFLGRLTGSNTAVTRLTAQLGGAVAGYGAMIAILGGVAIAITVIEKLAGYNSKAREEQDRLTKSLEDWYKVESQGVGGERVRQIEAEVAAVTKLNDQYLKLKNNAPAPTIGGEGGATIDIGAIIAPSDAKKIQDNGAALLAAQRDLTAKLEAEQVSSLTSLIQHNRATEAERDRAFQALVFLQGRLRNNLNVQGDTTATMGERSQIVNWIDDLEKALNPQKVTQLGNQLASLTQEIDRFTKEANDATGVGAKQESIEQRVQRMTDALDNYQRSLLQQLQTNKISGKTFDDLSASVEAERMALTEAGASYVDYTTTQKAAADAIALTKSQSAELRTELEQQRRDITGMQKDATDWLKVYDRMTKTEADFARSIREEGLRAIQEFARSGLSSWAAFFDSAERVTTQFFDRYEKRADDLAQQLANAIAAGADDLAAKLSRDLASAQKIAGILGLVGAGATGLSAGLSSGNIGTGVISGIVGGALSGGAWGAVVGGLAGAAGGLFGASEKQKEAAAALMAAAQGAHRSESVYLAGGDPTASQIAQIKQEAADLINQLKNAQTATLQDLVDIQNERDRRLQQVSTDFWDGIAASMNALKGPAGAFENTLADLKKQYDANVQSATALGASTADLSKITDLYNAQVNDVSAAYQHQIDQTRQGYQLRILNASGNSDAAFALQQQMELNDAFAQKLDQQTIVLLEQAQAAEKDRREREKQTQLLQDQLSTQQQSLEQFKAVYDALGQFKNSLATGQYSPLSPRAQLDAARGQLGSLYQSALGGDVNAGNQFSGVAQSFLDASRKYNASSAGYVVDYNSVNVMTDALRQAFGNRVSDTQTLINTMQANLAALNAVKDGIADLGTTMITVNAKLGAFYGEASDDQVAAAHDTTTAIVDVGRRLSASLDAIAQKVG